MAVCVSGFQVGGLDGVFYATTVLVEERIVASRLVVLHAAVVLVALRDQQVPRDPLFRWYGLQPYIFWFPIFS